MTSLQQAGKEIINIINKYSKQLGEKYIKTTISNNETEVVLTCHMENNMKITLRAIIDKDRSVFEAPMKNYEYQHQGGNKESVERFNQTNPGAWKIVVKETLLKNKIMETAFPGNDINWDINEFESNFINIILSKRDHL